jgi:hypothetical protein
VGPRLVPLGSVPATTPSARDLALCAAGSTPEGRGMEQSIVQRRSAPYSVAVEFVCAPSRRREQPVPALSELALRHTSPRRGGHPGRCSDPWLYDPPSRRPEATFWASHQTMSCPSMEWRAMQMTDEHDHEETRVYVGLGDAVEVREPTLEEQFELEIGRGGPKVRDWLRANGLGGRVVSLKHDITVWRRNDGRREIGYMRRDRLDRRKHPRVVIPTLVPLKAKQPILTRRAIPYFDKLQAALNAGHQGQEPLRGKGLEPPACPPCSRVHGDFVPWPCWAVPRWMPRWLEEYWNEHVAGVLEANRPGAYDSPSRSRR